LREKFFSGRMVLIGMHVFPAFLGRLLGSVRTRNSVLRVRDMMS
jgi:hypothetical protein